MSDACLVAGFALTVVGMYLVAGVGWTCLYAGAVLFAAGGLSVAASKQLPDALRRR